MKAFDPNHKLLDEMYQDEYYPAFLVDKVKNSCRRSSTCWRAAKPIPKWCRKRWTRRSAASRTILPGGIRRERQRDRNGGP